MAWRKLIEWRNRCCLIGFPSSKCPCSNNLLLIFALNVGGFPADALRKEQHSASIQRLEH